MAVLAGPDWRMTSQIGVAQGPHNVTASPDERYIAATSPPAGGHDLGGR
ncbi:MAG: hypothetical protein ACRDQW_12360 [Haloechinothrix sp.]